MRMQAMRAFIDGVGLLGPGLADWPSAVHVLSGRTAYVAQRTVLPPPAALPSAERRRTGAPVKLVLAIGAEAVAASGRDPSTLQSVFASSGADGHNCHAVCETLAGEDRTLSPTRFHNSVHNAPAGYWSIATGSMASSNVLAAYDGSFVAGLLESVGEVAVDGKATLLVVFDVDYPSPLRELRPIDDAFGVALVLAPQPSAHSLARIDIALTTEPATTQSLPLVEALRRNHPAARSLPLLEALATRQSTRVVLDYLSDMRLGVEIAAIDRDAGAAT